VGVVVGASATRTGYGFRAHPYANQQTIRGGWAFGASSGKVSYSGTLQRADSALGLGLRAFASGLEQINFFGLGNGTPEQTNRSRYHSPQTVFSVSPVVSLARSVHGTFTAGPEIRFIHSRADAGSILFDQSPYGVGRFGLVSLRTDVDLDTRPATTGRLVTLATDPTSADQPSGRAARVLASAFVTPAAWDVRETYGGIDATLAGYLGGDNLQLAARVGGQHRFGTYPWFDAAFLGGTTDRGFHSHRFAGDSSVFTNVELRAYFGGPHFASVFPVRFGLVAFGDTGRVWLAGDAENGWHPSAGIGALLKPVGTGIVLRAVVAESAEGALIYAGSGFRF
jgi:hypothetical protein